MTYTTIPIIVHNIDWPSFIGSVVTIQAHSYNTKGLTTIGPRVTGQLAFVSALVSGRYELIFSGVPDWVMEIEQDQLVELWAPKPPTGGILNC